MDEGERMGKRNPIASSTGLLSGHVVQKEGKKSEDSSHTPTDSLQWTSGERRTDEITSSDPCNETRFFYRLYAGVRLVPYKTPKIKRPIKIRQESVWEDLRRCWD